MKKKTSIFVKVGIFLILIIIGGSILCHFAESAYQYRADKVRLEDIRLMGSYIKEFHQKTGKYPLEGKSDKPNYVHLATEEQAKTIHGGPSYAYVVTALPEFLKELEAGLGRKIVLPFDPQRASSRRPIFYIYMIEENTYYFAVHLYEAFGFAKKALPQNYYKLEISNETYLNDTDPSYQRWWEYDTLMENREFIAAVSRKINKPRYFQKLRNEQDNSIHAKLDP